MTAVITGFIESLDEKTVVIKTAAGHKILWPIDNIPTDCQIGTVVTLTMSQRKTDDDQDKSHQEEAAKNFLNNFLKK